MEYGRGPRGSLPFCFSRKRSPIFRKRDDREYTEATMSTLITSRDNPRIKAARKLRQRRDRLEARRLLVEGARLTGDAWAAGIRPEVVFYDEAALTAASPAHALLHKIQEAGVECLSCSGAVFAELAETVTPQGIAAVLPLPQLFPPPQLSLVLLLDGVRDPGNAGTLLRSAEAVGVELVLCAPQTVDPWNSKVVRAGMGAHFRLPLRECATWDEVTSFLPAGMALYVADAHAPLAYDAVDWTMPSALIVGNEADGPSPLALALAQPIAIPMPGRAESLNAAMAGTVILFEAARRRRAGGPPPGATAAR